MAQLPPKIPNIVSQNPHLRHQQQSQWQEFMRPNNQNQQQNPEWVDEFIEFSSVKRGVHRRTVSESSVAFVESGPVSCIGTTSFRAPEMPTAGRNNNNNNKNTTSVDEFEKFDDEQFMSMFSNELGGSSSNPSSTSDHNSTNEDQKRKKGRERAVGAGIKTGDDAEKAEEVESCCKFDKDNQGQGKGQAQVGDEGSSDKSLNGNGNNNDNTGGADTEQQPVVDPKRVKRILANRQSAQRSRVRKLQYISELERSVTALQSEVSALSPRVAFLDHQRMILNVDNSTLKAKIAALAQDKIFKDAHQEAMKREIERLRQVYYQQNINKTESIVPPPSSSSLLPTTAQPSPSDTTTVHKNEQLTG